MRLLKLLLILVFICFPFGELLRFDFGNNIIIKPLDIFVSLSIIVYLFLSQKKKIKEFVPFFIFPMVGLLSLILNISWLHQNQIVTSFLYLLRWLSYAAIAVIISQTDKKFKKKIFFLLLLDGVSIIVFGYLQFFFYNSLKNLIYLGWDEHMHRMFSTFFDPNFLGSFLVLFVIFLAGIIYYLIQKKQQKKVIIFSIFFVLTIISIFLTFSRSAIIMLIIGFITFFILIHKKKLIVYLFIMILLFGIIMFPKFNDENMNLFRMNSTEGRFNNYQEAITIIKEKPFLGVGFNTYRYAKQFYGISKAWTQYPSHADAGVDNSFLFVVATTGVLGLLAYSYLWYKLLKRAYLLYRRNANIVAIIVLASSVALFIDAFFINSLFFAPIMLWMWVIVGLMKKD